MLLKRTNPAAWDKLCSLMDHNEDRSISTPYLHHIYTISTYYLHIIYSLPTQYLHRFARDEESLKMFKLISDFFLEELRLDWVTKAEIDHMVGRSSIPTLYLRNIYSISTQYLLNIYTGGGAAHQRLRERARRLLRPRRVTMLTTHKNIYKHNKNICRYPHLSLCSHSCQANLRHAVSPGHVVALQVSPESGRNKWN